MSSRTHQALPRLLARGRARAAATDAGHARPRDASTSATEGGNRFRPAPVMAAHDAFGGTSSAAAAITGAGELAVLTDGNEIAA